ncbi:hypothetical protein G6F57_022486 [Rhizopus arrhizus]|nr:hypothetical protein G6F57_022486 [Rhizopus arrhizus]
MAIGMGCRMGAGRRALRGRVLGEGGRGGQRQAQGQGRSNQRAGGIAHRVVLLRDVLPVWTRRRGAGVALQSCRCESKRFQRQRFSFGR